MSPPILQQRLQSRAASTNVEALRVELALRDARVDKLVRSPCPTAA